MDPRLLVIRRLATAGAVVIAGLYVLVGSGVVDVVIDQEPGAIPPLLVAAALFALLAVLLARSTRRGIWVAGAVLQVLVLAGYLAVSADRTPAFEVWGVTLKVLQALLLVALVFLGLQRTPRVDAEATQDARSPRQLAPR
jgi:hypothetical protein